MLLSTQPQLPGRSKMRGLPVWPHPEVPEQADNLGDYFCCFCKACEYRADRSSHAWYEVSELMVDGQPWGHHAYSAAGKPLGGPLTTAAAEHWHTPVDAVEKGVQWVKLWSCKRCLTGRGRLAQRQAASTAGTEFGDLVEELSQQRSASHAQALAFSQSQSQLSQPSQGPVGGSQGPGEGVFTRHQRAGYVLQLASMQQQLDEVEAANQRAGVDNKNQLKAAHKAAQQAARESGRLAHSLAGILNMFSSGGVGIAVPSTPTSQEEREALAKRLRERVRRMVEKVNEGGGVKKSLQDVLKVFKEHSRIGTAAGTQELMSEIRDMAVLRCAGCIA